MARYPSAIWRPTGKQGYGGDNVHLKQGVVVHSMEGSLAAAFSVLDGPREASWHFSVAKNGQAYQHVDSENISWTNGSYTANKKFWGIEVEGVAGEPHTAAQVVTIGNIIKWLFATHGTPGGFVRRVTLWEHNEMTAYGALPTACPSGRNNWPGIIQQASGGGGAGGFLMALTDAEQAEALTHLRNLDSENDVELARITALWQALLVDLVADGRGGSKTRLQLILDGALASIPMLVRSPTTGYIYEVINGKVVHGSNPVVAYATWGANFMSYVQVLDKANPEHAEVFKMEAEYPDGIPTELGGF